MSSARVLYDGQFDDGPSGIIWGNCPLAQIKEDPLRRVGVAIESRFENIGFGTNALGYNGGFAAFADDGVLIGTAPDEAGGALQVQGNDADNDEGHLVSGGNRGGAFVISDTAGSDKKLWFECCVKKASIADNALAFSVGLGEEGLAAVESLVDHTGALADKDFIGFGTLHAAGETMNFVYQKAGQTQVVLIAAIQTMVADTYYKLGFVYDPGAVAAKRIKVYVDGVEQTTYVTATQIATATFPDGEELAMSLLTKVGAAAESKLNMRWWRCAQLG